MTTSVQQAFLANYQADAPCCQEIGAAIGGKSALLVTSRVRALVMLVAGGKQIKLCAEARKQQSICQRLPFTLQV